MNASAPSVSTAALSLPASLTLRDARSAMATLGATIGAGGGAAVCIDASALQQIDSAALAVLLQCRRLAQQRGAEFTIENPPARLTDLARLYGVAELLGLA